VVAGSEVIEGPFEKSCRSNMIAISKTGGQAEYKPAGSCTGISRLIFLFLNISNQLFHDGIKSGHVSPSGFRSTEVMILFRAIVLDLRVFLMELCIFSVKWGELGD